MRVQVIGLGVFGVVWGHARVVDSNKRQVGMSERTN